MLIEAASVITILIMLLVGAITYGMWFMAANSLQQIANEGARSVLGTMNAQERQAEVDSSVAQGLLNTGVVRADKVTVDTALDGNFYTVTLVYDASEEAIFSNSLIPLPDTTITRSATVEISSL